MKKIILLSAVFIISIISFLILVNSVFAVSGDAQISGSFGGSSIVVTTTNRLAGAISQINWNGKDFLVSDDHGRSLQYAWFLNGYGGCDNPTEAGSAFDGLGSVSSSILVSLTSTANQLTTVSHPAFWVKPGTTPSYCTNTNKAINTTVASNDTLKKTVTVGYQGLSNVIDLVATITLSQPVSQIMTVAPIGVLTKDFSKFWTFDPRTSTLNDITGKLVAGAWGDSSSSDATSNLSVILSTTDQGYALGFYSPDIAGINSGERFYDVFNFFGYGPLTPVGAEFRFMNGSEPAGDYPYHNFVVIGTVAQVTDSLNKLYQIFPSKFESIVGYTGATCDGVSGWTGLFGEATQSITTAFYADGPVGTGSLIGTTSANVSSAAAVCTALGGSNCDTSPGAHTFVFSMPDSLKDGKTHTIYAYGVSGSNYAQLTNGSSGITPLTITCSGIASTPTPKPGDLNGDGKVDINDYNLLLSNFGNPYTIYDYNILVGNFGK